MKIGIIVYSKTGHTLTVARELEQRLSSARHDVTLEQVEPEGEASPNAETVPLANAPAVDGYDGLVFGCPVWGASVAPPMDTYLAQLPSLEGKEVGLLVTHAFPFRIMATRPLGALREACEAKGATILGSADVTWLSFRRRRQILDAVDALSTLFAGR
jgi:flavodoxin